MSVVKINALTVPADGGDEIARRFAARAGSVDSAEGFEGFELLRPTDERTTWLVVTRWRDEAAFTAWTTSGNAARAHGRGADGPSSRSTTSGSAGNDSADTGAKPPVATGAELWSFEIAAGAPGSATQ